LHQRLPQCSRPQGQQQQLQLARLKLHPAQLAQQQKLHLALLLLHKMLLQLQQQPPLLPPLLLS
jgi:hypothetical protein